MQSGPGPHHFRDGLGPSSTEDEVSGDFTPDTHVEAIMSFFLAVTIFYVLSRCRRLGWKPCHPFSVLFTSPRTTVKPWSFDERIATPYHVSLCSLVPRCLEKIPS